MHTQDGLSRELNTYHVLFYGLGTILGAGIYVLIGKVALIAGILAPLSFLVAALVAWATALSYAQLVVLFPKSAGEAVYVNKAFSLKWLSTLTGYLLLFTGIVSAATLLKGFTGYLLALVELNEVLVLGLAMIFLAVIACLNVRHSMSVLLIVTLIEVAGLLLVLFFVPPFNSTVLVSLPDYFIPQRISDVSLVFAGAFVAFYAFIGFEDMANISEEVKEPSTTMPKAIFWVMVISFLFYLLIGLSALSALPLESLQKSSAPLMDVVQQRNPYAARIVAYMSIIAIVNGVLVQLIMTSRVLYGMASQQQAPAVFAKVNQRTRTPIIATMALATLILFSAWGLPILTLAQATSFIVLTLFCLVNLSLIRVKALVEYQPDITLKSFPKLALGLCLLLLCMQVYDIFI